MLASLTGDSETWPLVRPFAISRGVRTTAEVVVASVSTGDVTGYGECFPYTRYNETAGSVLALIRSVEDLQVSDIVCDALRSVLPCGAARNAIDCALWSLRSQLVGVPVWKLAGLYTPPKDIVTAFTIGLDTPERMGEAARKVRTYPLLKLKLGGGIDDERVAAVRDAAPQARLIVDANEAWTDHELAPLCKSLADLGVELIEQPLPAHADEALRTFESPIPICADESCHDVASVMDCVGKYSAVNVKLDKSGGLTEGLEVVLRAREEGMLIMTGCTTATSLAMAPALILAALSDFVDLDGPLWLSEDRTPSLTYKTGVIPSWVDGVFGM